MSQSNCRDRRARRLRFETLEERRVLSTVTVSTTSDVTDGVTSSIAALIASPGADNKISLREAIEAANFTQGSDTIDFSTNPADNLNGGTINLTDVFGLRTLSITQAVTIDASMLSNGLTISAGHGTDHIPNTGDGFRIFQIEGTTGSEEVEINSLTLSGGDERFGAGAIGCYGANLTVKNTTITGNAGGGMIKTDLANVTVEDSSISGNFGRGIDFEVSQYYAHELNVVSSTISGNIPFTVEGITIDGGGIEATGYLLSADIQSSVITGNQSNSAHGGISFDGHDLSVQSSTISDNVAGSDGGGLYARATNGSITIDKSTIDMNRAAGFNGYGAGAVLSSDNSSVTITGTTISNNQALGPEDNVGGLSVKAENNSNVLIDGSKVVGNHADDDIGGLIIQNTASVVTVRNTTISDNTAHQNFSLSLNAAGGVWVRALDDAQTTIESSTISGNRILTPPGGTKYNAIGGGLFIQGAAGTTTTVRNSTISGNEAEGSGGGVKIGEAPSPMGGEVFILHSTITNNRADSDGDGVGTGGGIHVGSSGTTVTIEHTVIAGNFRGTGSARDDIINSATSPIAASWSLIGDSTGANITNNGGNQIGSGAAPIAPGLLPLALNGGPTMTHALQPNSPARDMGNPSAVPGAGGVPLLDQRGTGFPRKFGSRVDIGAYEISLPKVVDVRLDNLAWIRDPYSYAAIVPTGKQLAPIPTQGVKQIEIAFSEHVVLTGGELILYGSDTIAFDSGDYMFGYNSNTHVGTWVFDNPLPADKYRLELATTVKDAAGNPLDAEWANLTNGTPDDFADDPTDRTFLTGDGTPGAMDGQFKFFFSLLPGDSNQDGFVYDGSWNPTPVPALSNDTQNVADIDGDGDTDAADAALADTLAGPYGLTALPLSKYLGDYADAVVGGQFNDDDRVDEQDYLFWRAKFGTTDLRADGSLNGEVDAADYVRWRNELGKRSAWSTEPGPTAVGLFIVDFNNAPRVTDVIVSGSNSTHAPYSFEQSNYRQLHRVPVGGADTVSIEFSEDVNVEASHLRMVGLYSANVPTLDEFSYNMGAMTATWRFEGLVANDQYAIMLDDSVTDVEGNRLDGEWTNPGNVWMNSGPSEFPSGNGEAGGDFSFVITLLAGDAYYDGIVDWIDYDYFYMNYYGMTEGAQFDNADFDGDGAVGTSDYYLWYDNQGLDRDTVWVLGDLDGDFDVDQTDVDQLMGNWGASGATWADGDLNGDGDVDEFDLDLMFAQYGLELAVV